ncbi:hypothetical protein F652_2505 [Enterobacteriaceae bacterium bta3-1]|nr:hypothetical protein F652_2505 [Enterobacteriaceae bacterium bta3-1]
MNNLTIIYPKKPKNNAIDTPSQQRIDITLRQTKRSRKFGLTKTPVFDHHQSRLFRAIGK